jgi:hypothetical protein
MSAAEHATDHWDHKDLWRRHGRDFLIEVSRHNASPSSLDIGEGANRWAVYAYIYPKHPYFTAFNGPRLWQDATVEMPLHGGCSLLEYPMYEGKVTSVKVGADYHHLHDDFTHYGTKDEAAEVFRDAERLFAWLQARAASAGGEADKTQEKA